MHRDLKPANLFVTKDGRIKILDFGLAKLRRPQGAVKPDSDVETRKQITDPGVVMGTVGYMSPEQVRGEEADHRADIFAFGVILYEMLAGRRAFTGDSAAEMMSAILRDEPRELAATNARISPALEKIVRRCLEKKPERRFHSAHDLGFALEALSTPSGSRMDPAATALPAEILSGDKSGLLKNARQAWIAAGVLLLGLLLSLPFAIAYLRQKPPAEAVAMRFSIAPPEKATFNQIAISPDGCSLVFSATVGGKRQLWLRSMESVTPRPLPGTEAVGGIPFWSPDSRSVGFFADRKLKKLNVTNGTLQTLCNYPSWSLGGTWSREGTILFNTGSIICRVPATGGEPTPVPGLDQPPQGISYGWPSFLPDGRHFLYLVTTEQPPASEIYLASLDG